MLSGRNDGNQRPSGTTAYDTNRLDVPAGVERRYDDFCARDAELGDRDSS